MSQGLLLSAQLDKLQVICNNVTKVTRDVRIKLRREVNSFRLGSVLASLLC